MGMWVILIGDTQLSLDTVKAMRFEGKTKEQYFEGKQLDVYFNDGYVSFQYDFDGTIKCDYSPEELKSLPYDEPHFILMRYSNLKLLKQIVGAADFPKNILIDCDDVDLGLNQVIDKSIILHL